MAAVSPASVAAWAFVMSVRINVRKRDGVTALDLEGRIILGPAADSVARAIQERIAQGTRKIVLNMGGVQQVDTAGIGTVVRCFVSMQRTGGGMVLVSVPDRVRLVFEMSRLFDAIPSAPTEEEGLLTLR
jgi:anti-sigma B factor antagonist